MVLSILKIINGVSKNWRIIALIALLGLFLGGWYLWYGEKEKVAQLGRELEFERAKVDTVIIKGDIIEKVDTIKVIRRATKWKTVIREDTTIQVIRDTKVYKITNSGVVEIDTTITGR